MATDLQRLLNAFWLRPETALWRALDFRAMDGFEFREPSLDIGCGDGVFSFLRAGGEFDSRVDVFQAVANLDKYFRKADIYDTVNGFVRPRINRAPTYRISTGIDHKANLLQKANALCLYDELKVVDANQGLPFASASYASIFSNVIYWLDDPSKAIQEIGRVLKPAGRCCLMLPNTTLRDFSFYLRLCVRPRDKRFEFLERLDRGRMTDNIRHARIDADWRAIFEKHDLNVVRHHRHLSRVVVEMWDVGLRPIFPLLKQMVDKLEEPDLVRIKSEWVALFEHFLSPLLELDQSFSENAEEPAFHCYVLERAG
jgi:SAM-dependent methyltransferase